MAPRLAYLSLTFLTAGALGACTDPKGKLDDFAGRTVDAGQVVMIDASPFNVPDVTGTFYIGFTPNVAPNLVIHFLWDVTYTKNPDGTGKIKVTSTPLDSNRQKTTDVYNVMETDVSNAGEFTLIFDDSPLPSVSNPLTGSALLLDMTIPSAIKSKDFFCGALSKGNVVSPVVDLATSTYGAQRVAPGTVGAALPDPITHCPSETPADAGVPDAPVPDAPVPDAPLPDAPVPDAMVIDAPVDAMAIDAPVDAT